MDDTAENNTSHIRCEDELTLQRFLDEELNPDASELVFHHLQGCQRCATLFQDLKQSKSFCQERLGYEDEVEADFSFAILRRVRERIESTRLLPPAAQSARRSEQSKAPKMSAESDLPFDSSSDRAALVDQAEEKQKRNTTAIRLKLLRAQLRSRLADWSFWLRPGVVTTELTIILIVIGLILWLRAPSPVSAAELFRRASRAEEAMESRRDAVLRRAIHLEERQARSQVLLARRRIDIWQSAEHGITALRLYDEKGQLIAGEWKRAKGSRTIYRRRAQPQFQLSSKPQTETLIGLDNVWQLEPSAKSFSSLLKHPERASVEEKAAAYVIRCGNDATGGTRGLVRATLVLSRADYRAIEQTLVVEQDGEAREYRFIETSFEQRPASAVPLAVFEPEPELLNPTPGVELEPAKKQPKTEVESEPPASAIATTELEIRVLDLLNGIGADVGQGVSVTRTPKGQLHVQAFVETEQRKGEILRALAPVTTEPAVIIQIETIAEAEQRIARTRRPPGVQSEALPPAIAVRDAIPAHDQVRRYLSARGMSEERVEAEIGRVAARILAHSNRALLRVLALKNLAYRFSREELRALENDGRARWLAMLGAHAQVVGAESATLKRELSAIFGVSAPAPEPLSHLDITDEASLIRVVAHLVDLVSANDEAIRLAFTISAEATSERVKDAQFWRSLGSAADWAAKIHKATDRLKSSTGSGRQ